MKTNEAGINLIKSFEGCKLQSYPDIGGIFTIGYGSTGLDIVKGLNWTQDQAEERLLKDLEKFEKQVSEMVKVPLHSNSFSALVSFIYNLGAESLRGHTLLKKLNSNDLAGAAQEFVKWDHQGGKVIPGLLRRREAERDLFLTVG